ncbi:MAG: hypothetical protein ABIF18_00850 [archaeon]
MKSEFFIQGKVEAFFFQRLEDFVSKIEVVDHSVMVWAEAYEVFLGFVGFVSVYMMDVYDFVESANGTNFCCFSVGFEVYVISFSLAVCFVFVEVENVIVASGAEALGMNGYFSFASFACLDFWLPF